MLPARIAKANRHPVASCASHGGLSGPAIRGWAGQAYIQDMSALAHSRPLDQLGGRLLRRLIPAVIALLSIAGCGPTYPLYAPLNVAKSHGYSDTRVDAKTYLVTYRAPERTSLAVTSAQRNADSLARIALAYDMALWRASQLALANGYPAFTVTDRTNDVRVAPGYTDPYGAAFPYPPYYYGRGPYFPTYNYYYPDFWYISASVTLRVTFDSVIKPGAFDARDAIARLQAHYPNALVAGEPLS